jgi:hypothetical protein
MVDLKVYKRIGMRFVGYIIKKEYDRLLLYLPKNSIFFGWTAFGTEDLELLDELNKFMIKKFHREINRSDQFFWVGLTDYFYVTKSYSIKNE